MALGADKIATGHYAQVREFLGEWQLLKAEDGTKDQSYFLHRLNQAQLAKTLFPVGHLYKRDVRKIAEEAGLPNHARKDSTGICFIGERPFREFLARYLPKQPGEIRVLGTDRVVGRHEGLSYYTLGQREGLGIGGVKGAPEEPWFVTGKDMEKNVLWVVQGHDHPALLSGSLVAKDLSWVAGRAPHTHWVYAAKTRYRQPDAACEVERISAEECEVVFAAPQWAVTPGQSLVLYESRVCLGGGVIATARAPSE
jgi:tRNA-specific 2-thiouridylase